MENKDKKLQSEDLDQVTGGAVIVERPKDVIPPTGTVDKKIEGVFINPDGDEDSGGNGTTRYK